MYLLRFLRKQLEEDSSGVPGFAGRSNHQIIIGQLTLFGKGGSSVNTMDIVIHKYCLPKFYKYSVSTVYVSICLLYSIAIFCFCLAIFKRVFSITITLLLLLCKNVAQSIKHFSSACVHENFPHKNCSHRGISFKSWLTATHKLCELVWCDRLVIVYCQAISME